MHTKKLTEILAQPELFETLPGVQRYRLQSPDVDDEVVRDAVGQIYSRLNELLHSGRSLGHTVASEVMASTSLDEAAREYLRRPVLTTDNTAPQL